MAKKEKKASTKGKSFGKILQDITGKERTLLHASMVLLCASKLLLAIAPSVSGKITDGLAASAETGVFDMAKLTINCLLLAVMFAAGYGADGLINRMMVRISQTLVKKLRNQAQRKLNHLPINYMDTHSAGDLLSRVTNDLVTLSTAIESTLVTIVGQLVLLVGLMVMMFFTNWKLALIYMVVFPAGILILGQILKKTSALFRKQLDALGVLNGTVSDTYSNHMLIKAFGCEGQKADEFNESNHVFYDTYVKSRFLSGFMIPMSTMMNNVAYVALCMIGGAMLLNKSMTIGDFQAFIFYGNMIGSPFSALTSAVNNLQTGFAAADRIYEFLEEAEEPEETDTAGIDQERISGQVEFRHVGFGYVPEKQLMGDVSFMAKPGQTMAIVGPSGAGKTTLINLLMRFYEIWNGKIFIDGTDTRSLSKNELRSAFGMVLQDAWIFDGTILENIGYGRPDATREEIIAAAKQVQCDSFIDKLPDGYDTWISGENASLSAGEKQLLTIARAVLSDPKILILDEATSQVDSRTEALITSAMERMMEGRTSFIIAHRLYTIKNADQIIFMVDGDIKEVGSHKELLAKGGLYAEMYTSGSAAE